MLLCDLHCVFRFFEIRASNHEFCATGINGTLQHVLEVIFMALFAIVDTLEDGVAEVDSNL